MPEALIIRHVPFEDLGLLGPLLAERGYGIRYVEAPTAPLERIDPLAPALLVVLGGPIGAYEDDIYPFLNTELALIEQRLQAGRPLLGICLGSQLLARALGARVYPGPLKEIGWAPLTLTEPGRNSCLRHLAPEQTPVLHWHGDTFDLPQGAVRLASTEVCANQAFAWGRTALGLQFHAEAAGAALESWLVGHALEIAITPGISVPQLRADTERYSATLDRQGRHCFGEWLDGLAGRPGG